MRGRRKCEAVASRTYDSRNKAVRASRATEALRRSANIRYEIEESSGSDEEDGTVTHAPSPVSSDSDDVPHIKAARKRYSEVYSDEESYDRLSKTSKPDLTEPDEVIRQQEAGDATAG